MLEQLSLDIPSSLLPKHPEKKMPWASSGIQSITFA